MLQVLFDLIYSHILYTLLPCKIKSPCHVFVLLLDLSPFVMYLYYF